MNDPRLEAIARAAEELQRGHFDVDLPRGEGDEIDRVAGALESLSRDMAWVGHVAIQAVQWVHFFACQLMSWARDSTSMPNSFR